MREIKYKKDRWILLFDNYYFYFQKIIINIYVVNELNLFYINNEKRINYYQNKYLFEFFVFCKNVQL